MKKSIVILLITLAGCNGLFQPENDDPAVARADDKYLRISELAEKIPDGLPEKDSITLAQNYITKWLQQEILLQKARENLTQAEQDFSKQLEDYKQSLILFTFEQKLVSLFLDTVVSEEEIENYYLENKNQFELKGNIVKFDYIKLGKKSRQLRDFRKLMKSEDPEDVPGLQSLAEKNATDYWFAREWVAMNNLLDEIPLEVDNQALFLRRNKYAEAEDSLHIYLLRINDFRTTDSIPPLDMEREKIRNIILNGRKINLIEMKRQEIIEQAFMNERAEIF